MISMHNGAPPMYHKLRLFRRQTICWSIKCYALLLESTFLIAAVTRRGLQKFICKLKKKMSWSSRTAWSNVTIECRDKSKIVGMKQIESLVGIDFPIVNFDSQERHSLLVMLFSFCEIINQSKPDDLFFLSCFVPLCFVSCVYIKSNLWDCVVSQLVAVCFFRSSDLQKLCLLYCGHAFVLSLETISQAKTTASLSHELRNLRQESSVAPGLCDIVTWI